MSDVGRISRELTWSARRIVFGANVDPSIELELQAASEIDRAHLVMLSERMVLNAARVRALIQEIEVLRANGFAPLRGQAAPRGLYLLYERYLIEKLGHDIGGILQTARSRNDLNATLLRLRLRAPYHDLIGEVLRLQAVLIRRARRFADVVMPVYTHYQPAVPITFGHYLAGIAMALGREIRYLVEASAELAMCPLGAGAGGGTSLPIDPARTAELLGFDGWVMHSLDAVASRDLVLRLLSGATTLGVVLSRLASDLLLWTTGEFAFVQLPDELVGSSSMMPQKRNPFLLEHVQGRSTAPLGAFVAAAMAMHAKPFTNSIAVGGEAVAQVWTPLTKIKEAVTLARLVVSKAQPRQQAMLRKALDGYTCATELANRLVVGGKASFRTAHRTVAAIVRDAIERGGESLHLAASRWLRDEYSTTLLQDLDPTSIACATLYGGGPGNAGSYLATLQAEWSRQMQLKREQQEKWRRATANLDQAVRTLMSQAPDE